MTADAEPAIAHSVLAVLRFRGRVLREFNRLVAESAARSVVAEECGSVSCSTQMAGCMLHGAKTAVLSGERYAASPCGQG